MKFSRAHVCSQKLNVIEWQLSLNIKKKKKETMGWGHAAWLGT